MSEVNFRTPNHSISSYVVKQFERKHDLELPHDYRNFLMQFNGGRPEPDCFDFGDGSDASTVQCFLGIGTRAHDDIEKKYGVFIGRVPEQFLPIAYDPGGNLICIGIDGLDRGKVYFWDRDGEADDTTPDMSNMHLLAESFPAFLDGLYPSDEHDL